MIKFVYHRCGDDWKIATQRQKKADFSGETISEFPWQFLNGHTERQDKRTIMTTNKYSCSVKLRERYRYLGRVEEKEKKNNKGSAAGQCRKIIGDIFLFLCRVYLLR